MNLWINKFLAPEYPTDQLISYNELSIFFFPFFLTLKDDHLKLVITQYKYF